MRNCIIINFFIPGLSNFINCVNQMYSEVYAVDQKAAHHTDGTTSQTNYYMKGVTRVDDLSWINNLGSELLVQHIRAQLPQLRTSLQQGLSERLMRLQALGEGARAGDRGHELEPQIGQRPLRRALARIAPLERRQVDDGCGEPGGGGALQRVDDLDGGDAAAAAAQARDLEQWRRDVFVERRRADGAARAREREHGSESEWQEQPSHYHHRRER